jgi:hypothetical protein
MFFEAGFSSGLFLYLLFSGQKLKSGVAQGRTAGQDLSSYP